MAFEPVDCRIDAGLDSLLGKWKIPVLIQLRATPVLRFSDLQRALPDVTKKMLTQTLRELAADDLVQRTVYPTVPPKVEYRLTAHGQELIPTLDALHAWGINPASRPLTGVGTAGDGGRIKSFLPLSRKNPLQSFGNLVYYYLLEIKGKEV